MWLLSAATGCFPTQTANPPVIDAITLVVADAHGRLDPSSTLYVAGDGIAEDELNRARLNLLTALAVVIYSPSERAAGPSGNSIALGRFRLDDDGMIRVVAGVVNEAADELGCIEYVLAEEDDGWSIVDAAEIWPDCPISQLGGDTFHAVLDRARSADCLGKWAVVGTCGEWLMIGESTGFTATNYYFDSWTGLAVAIEACTDTVDAGAGCHFTFGEVECDPAVTRTIPCDPE